ncbi:MAG TPA: D-alanine--D-alanine ligase family protein, partial [Thermoanaerobaculia bacterium]|nr:D-alanine--D-alanine ligase family protein [Thermoanaerobaculia bacterium]
VHLMTNTIRTVLLFGGRSAEHEVSILSARSVAATAPPRIELIPICIARDGRFVAPERSARILAGEEKSVIGDADFSFEIWARSETFDIVLPLIHGTGGEDGALQGYLETLGIPYVGSGVTASAVGMDKVHMKQAFASAKLPMVDYVAVTEAEWKNERERVTRAVANVLRLPYFAKPANSGSSVGVTKVKKDTDLGAAIELALRFDEKVLIERGIDAREIEVSVLGNESPEASVAGEIVAAREFYDYSDKYVENKSQLVIPAKLAKDKSEEIRRYAVTAFRVVGASGFARVDFFLERGTNRLYVNEINTIPGFTNISMYPKLWEATELKYARLIERLIELGVERARARKTRREGMMQWFDEVAGIA